ncbi:MAG: tetratricopeptide repeat protein [Bacteroidetes bacterium]|nr:tetratricopeptide repeat protein [Bacteroidota bacterium]MBU1423604.1 tetratricopeptide repeat protein [Bacteroidota bacterium]MBU2636718.1 tetratricopeptide repeat protein [Bacteroidota bacterium]
MKLIIYILLFCSVGLAQSERSLIREGNIFYKDGKYTDSEVNYRKSLEQNKDSHIGIFNLGDALYKQEKFEEAAEQFRIATTKETNNQTKAQAYHNLGNSLLKVQKLPESIEAYKNSLKINPKDFDTKYNLEYAKALLKQQQQSASGGQQDQQNQDKQKRDQQKEEQQKQEQQKQDQQKAQQQKQQISKEDAERMLEALKNEEKDVQKKLKKKAPARISIEKDW